MTDERHVMYTRMRELFAAADARGWFSTDELDEFLTLSAHAARARMSLAWLNFRRYCELIEALPEDRAPPP